MLQNAPAYRNASRYTYKFKVFFYCEDYFFLFFHIK